MVRKVIGTLLVLGSLSLGLSSEKMLYTENENLRMYSFCVNVLDISLEENIISNEEYENTQLLCKKSYNIRLKLKLHDNLDEYSKILSKINDITAELSRRRKI